MSTPQSYGPPPLTQAQEREKQDAHVKACEAAASKWKKRAEAKDWDQVRAPLSVYVFSGSKVTSDPRREAEYKERVLKEPRGIRFRLQLRTSQLIDASESGEWSSTIAESMPAHLERST